MHSVATRLQSIIQEVSPHRFVFLQACSIDLSNQWLLLAESSSSEASRRGGLLCAQQDTQDFASGQTRSCIRRQVQSSRLPAPSDLIAMYLKLYGEGLLTGVRTGYSVSDPGINHEATLDSHSSMGGSRTPICKRDRASYLLDSAYRMPLVCLMSSTRLQCGSEQHVELWSSL